MKFTELKDRKEAELAKLVVEKKESLRAIRSNLSGSKSRNVKEIMAIKKDVARALTALNQQSKAKK